MVEQGMDPEREPAGRRARPAKDEDETYGDKQDWTDEAAAARTLDDPRRRTPHDDAGVPSGDTGQD
jgi:hypothetical protein